MAVTFVTAFHPIRSGTEDYFNRFEGIAKTGIPILLFLDKACEPPSYPNVKVIPVTLDLSWIPEDAELPIHRNHTKDTREYLGVILQKLKYLNDALQYCDTPYLAWIDFGLSHVIKNPSVTFQKLVELQSFSYPLSRILNPGCWNPVDSLMKDSICWRFCGGFLLGPRTLIQHAYIRQTELVKEHLPTLVWEVNYWACMEEFFTWYSADHNDSILMNIPYTRT
jgi:hypothetical protein